jgi:hypothetical protein
MKIWGWAFLLSVSVSCSTTRVTYEMGEARDTPLPQKKEQPTPPEPETRMLRSVPATVTFDYPERVRPALYRVTRPVNVRDFPSAREGNIVGQLKVGETVVGNEIEGAWIRIYENSYTSLNALKRINYE